jgi:hypothetical protein
MADSLVRSSTSRLVPHSLAAEQATLPKRPGEHPDVQREDVAKLLGLLVPPADMHELLRNSQRLLLEIRDDLDRTTYNAKDLLRACDTHTAISQRWLRNQPSLDAIACPIEQRLPYSPVLITQTVEEIHAALVLVASSMNTFRQRLAVLDPYVLTSSTSEIAGSAAILGTASRVQSLLAATPREDLTPERHERLRNDMKVLINADATYASRAYEAINSVLDVYTPSDAVITLMRRTFEPVYREDGLADSLREFDRIWPSFTIQEKTVVANFFLNAIWIRFNRELGQQAICPDGQGAPFSIVFDRDPSAGSSMALEGETLGSLVFVPTAYSTGVIILSDKLAQNQSALETFVTVAHEVAHGLIYYMLQHRIIPLGCEADMKWLAASLNLNEERAYFNDPHERLAWFVDQSLAQYFAR